VVKVIDRAPAGRDEARPGRTWSLVTTRKGPEAWEPIAAVLASWEAKHRTLGADRNNVYDTDVARNQESARGIRRRLVKPPCSAQLAHIP
jgi:hypothetical protein